MTPHNMLEKINEWPGHSFADAGRSWVWVKRRVPPRCDDLLHTTRWTLWAPDMGSVKHPTFCRLWSYGYGSYEAVKTGVTLVVASDLNWS